MLVHSDAESCRTSDGCLISYTLRPAARADAPRLALVHPLALDRTIWSDVAERLGDRVSLLTYDCRGHGRSERKAMPFTIGLFAQDLAELFNHVRWPVATLAGCSMGGCVALAFAGRYAQRLKGLALIDTTAWYGADAPQKWRERAATAADKGLAGMLEFQTTRWFSDAFRERHPETVAGVSEIFLANDVECYRATCAMLGDLDLRHVQKSTQMPVSVVVGEEDYATPLAMSQQMHAAISGSTLTVLSGVRHLAPVEAPAEVASQLLSLLERVD
jgi:3-oxoadipate enol-lactonase